MCRPRQREAAEKQNQKSVTQLELSQRSNPCPVRRHIALAAVHNLSKGVLEVHPPRPLSQVSRFPFRQDTKSQIWRATKGPTSVRSAASARWTLLASTWRSTASTRRVGFTRSACSASRATRSSTRARSTQWRRRGPSAATALQPGRRRCRRVRAAEASKASPPTREAWCGKWPRQSRPPTRRSRRRGPRRRTSRECGASDTRFLFSFG